MASPKKIPDQSFADKLGKMSQYDMQDSIDASRASRGLSGGSPKSDPTLVPKKSYPGKAAGSAPPAGIGKTVPTGSRVSNLGNAELEAADMPSIGYKGPAVSPRKK